MATYIPQVQDKVTSVRPPQTDWQFEAQLLSTRQAKYDTSHDKLSKMYGEILNSGLTREGNIEAREEFFKLIDSDLRKVAGIDLSLDSNVSQAKQVFNQIYENDYLVKDMVWTKNFQNEMQRAEGFRSCTDSDECGGEYWDDGVKYMQYKREEFKNSTNDESMGIQNTRYIPYNNMMEASIKAANDAGLSITQDTVNGGYVVTEKNGEKVLGKPLTRLFSQLFKDNPGFQDQYNVKAYNERKDWTHNAVRSGEFENLEDAALGYVEARSDIIQNNFDKLSKGVKYDVDELQDRFDALTYDGNNTGLTSEELKEYERTGILLQQANEADKYLGYVRQAKKNLHSQSGMNAVGEYLDMASSAVLFNNDITENASILSNKDSEFKIEADKFALKEQDHKNNVKMAYINHDLAKKLETHKAQYSSQKYKLGGYQKSNNLKQAKMVVENWEPLEELENKVLSNPKFDNWKDLGFSDYETIEEFMEYVTTSDSELQQGRVSTYQALLKEVEKDYTEAMMDVNKAAVEKYEFERMEGRDGFKLDIDWGYINDDMYNDLLRDAEAFHDVDLFLELNKHK